MYELSGLRAAEGERREMSGSMPDTFASAALAASQGLLMIGKLLGPTHVTATTR
jgi:hypothetical protein